MSLQAIIARRRQALLAQWRHDPLIQVQVESLAALAGFTFLEDASVGAVGRRNARNVGYLRRPGNPDASVSLWVAANYGDYRNAYQAFVREVYRVSAASADLGLYEVDHLLNRARSPLDTTFIRVEAVLGSVNQQWGRTFEKAASHPDFFANQTRERRTMSWAVASKIAGQLPPDGPNDQAGMMRLTRFWVSQGFPAREVEDGLRSMWRFAYSLR